MSERPDIKILAAIAGLKPSLRNINGIAAPKNPDNIQLSATAIPVTSASFCTLACSGCREMTIYMPAAAIAPTNTPFTKPNQASFKICRRTRFAVLYRLKPRKVQAKDCEPIIRHKPAITGRNIASTVALAISVWNLPIIAPAMNSMNKWICNHGWRNCSFRQKGEAHCSS